MKRFFLVAAFVCSVTFLKGEETIEEMLRDAPLLDAPGPGYPGRTPKQGIFVVPPTTIRIKPKMDPTTSDGQTIKPTSVHRNRVNLDQTFRLELGR